MSRKLLLLFAAFYWEVEN